MDNINNYLYRLVSVAIIVSLGTVLTKNKGTISAGVKLLSGLLLVITFLKPFLGYDFNISHIFSDIHLDAEYITSDAINTSLSEQKVIIKENVEAYVLNKASSLGVEPEIHITLTETYPYVPMSVTLTGAISPYTKSVLSDFLFQELGIPKENQKWN